MKIDHIGLTTPDLEAAMSGMDLLRGPFDNVERGVRQAFVRIADGPVLELLSPLTGTASPIAQHVRSGGGAHHICFVVADLDGTVHSAEQAGARVIVAPTPDVAFEGRSIAFVLDPVYGLIEFLESDCAVRGGSEAKGALHVKESLRALPASEIESVLAQVFAERFPALDITDVAAARYEATPGWDSLGHMRLIMALEQRLGITIPSDVVTELLDYASVRRFLVGV